jgi:hypothetical protein
MERSGPPGGCGYVLPWRVPARKAVPDCGVNIVRNLPSAGVAELVDALDLGSSGESRGGSSPSARTTMRQLRDLRARPYSNITGAFGLMVSWREVSASREKSVSDASY